MSRQAKLAARNPARDPILPPGSRKGSKAPDENDKLVGQRIRVARLSRRMSQTDLANHLGITFQQVQKYERGSNRVAAGRLTQIAEATKRPVPFFFGGDDPSSKSSMDLSANLSLLDAAGAVRLVQAYTEIENAMMRRNIVDMVEALAKRKTSP